MGWLPGYSRSLQELLQQRFDLLVEAPTPLREKLICNVYCRMNNEMHVPQVAVSVLMCSN
jgi:hypothetical protein